VNGPQTPFADQLHAEKYRATGESFDEAMNRIAAALTDGTREQFLELREILRDMRFMPGGRIQSAVGSIRKVTPYNCFVSGTIDDSFVDGSGSIMGRATEAATTMRMGGGIGYDFSTLRPRGAPIKKLGSTSSGPISFMSIFDAICKCVASSGHRRGAQMGVLRVDHPDIEEFIHCKQNSDTLTGFNISIGITDDFMRSVEQGQPFDLKWRGEVYATIDAAALWEKIMRSTWDWAEPGVLFIDAINDWNNLRYCETIAATNPCGEQPLPPNGACLLGSFNLTRYIVAVDDAKLWAFDWDQFRADIKPVVRAMDRVIDIASYPLREQEQEAHDKRRMGLGITGLANAGEALGYKYGTREFLDFEEMVLMYLRDDAYYASCDLAEELGSFPALDVDQFLDGPFAQTFPPVLRVAIAEQGLRNSHLISIAPTGTISLCADNVSSGIEPVFARVATRTVQTDEGPVEFGLVDYGWATWGIEPTECHTVTAEEHLAVLTTAQRYVDSSVSKTCNVSPLMAWSDFKQLYMDAWKGGAKGCTTFNPEGKRMGILKAEPENVACKLDPETGRKDCE
jgi:ribonucleoside-diphosphate reductase alpha chain